MEGCGIVRVAGIGQIGCLAVARCNRDSAGNIGGLAYDWRAAGIDGDDGQVDR